MSPMISTSVSQAVPMEHGEITSKTHETKCIKIYMRIPIFRGFWSFSAEFLNT